MEKGKIKVTNKLGGKINKLDVPKFYDLSPREKYNNKEIEYELKEGGGILKVYYDGTELPKDETALKEKEAKEQKKKDNAKYNKIKEFKKDSFVDISKSFIPRDTSEVLSNREYIVDNFNLELNKLPRYEDGKFQFYKVGRRDVEFQPKQNFSKDLINQISKDEQSMAKSLFKNEASYNIINFKPNWRLIVGLGGESVYETSITLHHIYGTPYIPASSIKGVVRSWIINTVFGNDDLHFAEGRAIQDKSFCDFFGCPAELKIDKTKFESFYTKIESKKKGDRKGKIIFLDAFPTTEPKIEVDIMNTHYPEYYSGSRPPTDTQNPVPIMFLTVAKTNFQFIIGTKENSLLDYKINDKMIVEWLKEALSVHGIGAKTAVGYGRLNAV